MVHPAQGQRSRLASLYGVGPEKTLTKVGDKPAGGMGGPVFTATYPTNDGSKYFSGGAALVSTAGDYFRFCQMLLNQGELDGARVLKAETVDRMTKNQLGEVRSRSPGRMSWGLGSACSPRRARRRRKTPRVGTYGWGGAFGTYFWVDPRNELVGVWMTQVFPPDSTWGRSSRSSCTRRCRRRRSDPSSLHSEVLPMVAKRVPDGYHRVTPHLTVRNASEMIEFYKKAFGAVEKGRAPGPDGKSIMHAAIQIGDSIVFLNDEFPDMGALSPLATRGRRSRSTCTSRTRTSSSSRPWPPGPSGNAPGRPVLGRPVRHRPRPVRPPVVDRQPSGGPVSGPGEGADGEGVLRVSDSRPRTPCAERGPAGDQQANHGCDVRSAHGVCGLIRPATRLDF